MHIDGEGSDDDKDDIDGMWEGSYEQELDIHEGTDYFSNGIYLHHQWHKIA